MILVDAHVHIYDCFDLATFLDSAISNFEAEAVRCAQNNVFTAFLLLTESTKENWFQLLESYAREGKEVGNKSLQSWSFHRTNERCSLLAERVDGQELYLVAGHQIVTVEGLEVLALATEKRPEDGLPIKEVVQAVKENDGIPVIPWGFGKWIGKRGEVLDMILKSVKRSELFLGDNSGRPKFLPRPSHFNLAEQKGIHVLPGSDPLPFESECWRPGSFGLSVEGSISSEQPAEQVRSILGDQSAQITAYGKLENPYRFFRNQLRMQLMKQLRKRFLVK